MIIVAADTDSKGSIALLDCRNLRDIRLDVYETPNRQRQLSNGSKRSETNYPALVATMVELISSAPVDKVYLEEQWSRPKQGVASTFGFGQTYGEYRAATAAGLLAAGTRLEDVESKIVCVPGKDWKPAMRLGDDKSLALSLATRLFPLCAQAWAIKTRHTSAAEASLLALYGASKEGVKIPAGAIVRPFDKPLLTSFKSLVIEGSTRKVRKSAQKHHKG